MEFEVWAVRAWFSVPIAKGIRAGVSVNPNSFVTRRLPWYECLSDTGKKVSYVGSIAIICGMAWWVIDQRDHLDVMWLTMLIVGMFAIWILKRSTLAIFPRQFQENEPAAQAAQHPEQRYNSFGEPIETPTPARSEIGLKAKSKS
jgi:hypothetical protein